MHQNFQTNTGIDGLKYNIKFAQCASNNTNYKQGANNKMLMTIN